jgi:ABC-2 type transport system permease protein
MKPASSPPDLAPGPDGEPLAAALPRARSPVLKYLKICRSSLTERMAYRADFMVSTFLRFLPMLTTILLWMAVYAGAGKLEKGELGGFDLNEMISYLLLVHISRMFSSMPGLAHGIARDIRDGGLKKYLIQPVEMLPYLLSYRVAHKAAYITMTALPYALLFWLCSDFLPGWPDAATLAAYAVALVLGFLVGFFFEASIGMLGFWLLEVSSFLYVINTLTFFLSGHMFPFDLLPEPFAALLKHLPFQYLAYFPAAVFLGKVQGEDLLWGLLAEAAWAAAFMVMAAWLYRRGLRHYSAYGG